MPREVLAPILVLAAIVSAQAAGPGPPPPTVAALGGMLGGTVGNGYVGLPSVVGDNVTDDWSTIQNAVDAAYAAGGGLVILPAKPSGILISQALRMRSNVTLWLADWNQKINCAGSSAVPYMANWPFYSCVMLGSGESNNLALISTIPVNDPTIGSQTLTFSSGNYSTLNPIVGDILSVEASTTFDVGSQITPQTAQLEQVTGVNASSHQVTISTPIEVATIGTVVRKLTNNGLFAKDAEGDTTAVPMWASYRAQVIGGAWTVTQGSAPFSSSGGGLEPTIKVKSITGAYGAGYVNLLQGASIEVEQEHIGIGHPIELSWISARNKIRIGSVEMAGISTSQPELIGIFEGSRSNDVDVSLLNVGASNPTHVVEINRAQKNQVRIGTLIGGAISGNSIFVTAADDVGSPLNTADNKVRIDTDSLSSVVTYAAMSGIYQGATATIGGTLTGYTNGQVVTQGTTGGACTVPPTWTLTVGGGNVTAATIDNPGACGGEPTNPVSVSGGLTLGVSYNGSQTVDNVIEYGYHHGMITNVNNQAFSFFGVGAGNWIEGWGDNGAPFCDTSSQNSGFKNLYTPQDYLLSTGFQILLTQMTSCKWGPNIRSVSIDLLRQQNRLYTSTGNLTSGGGVSFTPPSGAFIPGDSYELLASGTINGNAETKLVVLEGWGMSPSEGLTIPAAANGFEFRANWKYVQSGLCTWDYQLSNDSTGVSYGHAENISCPASPTFTEFAVNNISGGDAVVIRQTQFIPHRPLVDTGPYGLSN